jgi:F1F0 ATPase subunit 2
MDAQAMTISYLGDGGSIALRAVAWLACGALVGAFYFLTLRWNVMLLAAGRAPILAMALLFARFAFVAVLLAFIASRFGALPLLLATAGFLPARMAAVRLGAPT